MSTTLADRWYILPFETVDGDRLAKYVNDDARIHWFSGTTVDMSDYPGYPLVSGEHLLARVHGEWMALQELSAQPDTRTIAINAAQAATMLNQRFGAARPIADWLGGFRGRVGDQTD